MKLVPENFKLIPTTYNGNDFMKIQYEDKDLVMKLKGEFHIIDVKNYGLRLIFTPDDYSIIDKIHENKRKESKKTKKQKKQEKQKQENKKIISLSMNKTTPFFNHKNILMDQNKCRSKHNALKKIMMRGCVAVCFSSFSIIYDRLNAYAKQVKVNEFLKEEEIKSLFDNED